MVRGRVLSGVATWRRSSRENMGIGCWALGVGCCRCGCRRDVGVSWSRVQRSQDAALKTRHSSRRESLDHPPGFILPIPETVVQPALPSLPELDLLRQDPEAPPVRREGGIVAEL